MSGIAGVYYLDGRPVDRGNLERMKASIAHRGPDDAGIWARDQIGFVQRMLWTTPESLREKLPLSNRADNLTITADARIDNRIELLASLDFTGHPHGEVTDSELILAAYEKWGDRCPEKLLGDFAFAIWDSRRQTLFCARDHFGIRPFYYYRSDQVFVFGSEVKALLCLPGTPQRLNELMIGYHLAATAGDNTVTFYQDIFRLPPSHCMTISRYGTQLHNYWSPDTSTELKLGSDNEYAEAFREIFSEAVRCRLRSAFPLGSELSGGLDSSSVTCMARELLVQNGNHPLHSFSSVYDKTPESDERSYIQAVLAQGNLEPHYVNMDDISPLADMEQVFWLGDETFTSPTVYIPWEICRQAQKQGVRVLLSGLDGDTTVSHGFEYMIDMVRSARWAEFATETRAIDQHPHLPGEQLFLEDYGFPYLTESVRSGRWVSFLRGVNGLSTHFNIPRRYLFRNYGIKPFTPEPLRHIWRTLRGRSRASQKGDQFIRPDFSRRIDLDRQLAVLENRHLRMPQTSRDAHGEALSSDVMPYMFEWANRTTTAFSIEGRHPFADKRLVELCLSLPPRQKLHKGWTRMIMRRAMAGILPEEIRWRGGKTVNSAAFRKGFRLFAGGLLEDVITNAPEKLDAYINIGVLRKLSNRYLSGKADDGDIMRIWQAMTLALWLRHVRLSS